MKSDLASMALAVTTLLAVPEAAAAQQTLSLDLIFGDSGEQRPGRLAWMPDGHRLSYLWDDGTGRALWILDARSGESRAQLHLTDLEDAYPGLTFGAYHWAPDGGSLVLESDGVLYLYTVDSGEIRRLTSDGEEVADPKFSPTGGRVAFIRDFDLFLVDLDTGVEQQLTEGGERNTLLNGVTDWVYWEELWGRSSTGYWWNGDGTSIAYYQFDESPVDRYSLVNFQSRYPEVEWQKYPKAGRDNPLVRVGVLDVEQLRTIWLDTGDRLEWYLPRIDWTPAGQLAVQRLNRDQNRLELLRCDPAEGDCSIWLTETSRTWIDVSDDYRFLPDGRLIWPSERTGWNQLYLIDAEGDVLCRITDAEGAATSLVGVDPESGELLYTAYGPPPLGALSRQVYRTDLSGADPTLVSPADGWSSTIASPNGRHWVHVWSTAAKAPTSTLRSSGAEAPIALPYQRSSIASETLPQREFFTIPGADAQPIPASLIKPPGFDPGRRYPAIMYHYGGPESQVISDRWSQGTRELWTRMMAQRGYVMFSVDNRGSNYFGQAGADAMHRRFGEVNLAAQKAGVEYLESLGWVDADRIGLWGWSGGGANTLYSVLRSPGTWRAAVAGAPVTDWHLYDTIWTERYLDHPEGNPDGYRDSSAITWAANLTDELLIVHGTADDNVHPQNSLVMSQKLIEAGVQFDQAIYPRQKHGFRDQSSRHFYERMTRFFDRHLGGDEPLISRQAEPKG